MDEDGRGAAAGPGAAEQDPVLSEYLVVPVVDDAMAQQPLPPKHAHWIDELVASAWLHHAVRCGAVCLMSSGCTSGVGTAQGVITGLGQTCWSAFGLAAAGVSIARLAQISSITTGPVRPVEHWAVIIIGGGLSPPPGPAASSALEGWCYTNCIPRGGAGPASAGAGVVAGAANGGGGVAERHQPPSCSTLWDSARLTAGNIQGGDEIIDDCISPSLLLLSVRAIADARWPM